MATMKKTLKKYERPILLAIVVILLATFSVTGAVQCGQGAPGGSLELGGSFNVSPSERAEISDEEFDRRLGDAHNFQRVMGNGSRENDFLRGLFASLPPVPSEALWMELMTVAAAERAGYRVGDHQVHKAVEDLAGMALMGGARLPFTDVNYQQFLKQNRMDAREFEAYARNVVLRDQFLYPLITSVRYVTTYPQAYEQWKVSRERVDLEYVALATAPFAEEVRLTEQTRITIGEQLGRLSKLTAAAAQVRHVHAVAEAQQKKEGAYPASLDGLKRDGRAARIEPDVWGTVLLYELKDEKPVVTSAGPDEKFGTADDITYDTQKQLDTRSRLHKLAGQLQIRHTADKAWPESLDALTKSPGGDRLPSTAKLLKDGWEREFVYDAKVPSLASNGLDGEAGTDDDIRMTLDPETVTVPLGPGLEVFGPGEAKDAWDRAFAVHVEHTAPFRWAVVSAGPDGEPGNDDDVDSDNERELRGFFRARANDYRLPERRRFETIIVHLPLLPDAVLAKLWEKYPEHRPVSEDELYSHWLTYKGPGLFYSVEDPADPEAGHGAAAIRKAVPEGALTLVPGADVFPAELSDPNAKEDDEGKDDEGEDDGEPEDAEPKDDEPKDDEPKDDEPKDDEPGDDEPEGDDPDEGDVETPAEADRRIYREKGWRRIVIREQFMEAVLNGLLTKARESRERILKAEADQATWEKQHEAWEQAVAAWEKANADKPEAERGKKPIEPVQPEASTEVEVTFESLMKDELGDALAAAPEGAPAAIRHWTTPELMSRKAWSANKHLGFQDEIKYALDGLKTDGQYAGIPTQVNRRNTKILVRLLELRPEEQQKLEDVHDDVFARFVEWRQMDRAARSLEELKTSAEEAAKALGEDADDAAKRASFVKVLAEWSKAFGDDVTFESTGLFIGSDAPPDVEVADDTPAGEAARLERRNFIWRAGYGTVERQEGERADDVEPAPGTFGRTILRDQVVKDRDPEIVDGKPAPKDTGTGNAYLVRVKERVYPTQDEFSPQRYAKWLETDVFGVPDFQRRRPKPLKEMDGRLNAALSHWYEDIQWMTDRFKLETNSPIKKPKDGKRE